MDSMFAQDQRIGVFGGCFNPVHTGHLIAAQDALEAFDLWKVVFVPCAIPPHKSGAGVADGRHRLAMVAAAVEGNPHFEVSDMEIRRGGVSYTIATVKELRRLHPGCRLVFIIGSDTVPELPMWRDIQELVNLCEFAVIARPGGHPGATGEPSSFQPEWVRRLAANARRGHALEVSSSDIRYRIAEGLSIHYLVPPAVEMYIAEHGLYYP